MLKNHNDDYILVKKNSVEHLILLSLYRQIELDNKREIGKCLQLACEYVCKNFINQQTNLSCLLREESDEIKTDKNASGFDLVTTETLLTINAKCRTSQLHMAPSGRRMSFKNQKSLDQGYSRYAIGEADVYMIVIPNDDYLDYTKWDFIAIPEYELYDPKIPGYLLGTVPKDIEKKYKGIEKSILTLQELNEKKKQIILEISNEIQQSIH
jgi:hypothetical protein